MVWKSVERKPNWSAPSRWAALVACLQLLKVCYNFIRHVGEASARRVHREQKRYGQTSLRWLVILRKTENRVVATLYAVSFWKKEQNEHNQTDAEKPEEYASAISALIKSVSQCEEVNVHFKIYLKNIRLDWYYNWIWTFVPREDFLSKKKSVFVWDTLKALHLKSYVREMPTADDIFSEMNGLDLVRTKFECVFAFESEVSAKKYIFKWVKLANKLLINQHDKVEFDTGGYFYLRFQRSMNDSTLVDHESSTVQYISKDRGCWSCLVCRFAMWDGLNWRCCFGFSKGGRFTVVREYTI